jgi:hypothetical protein
MKRDKQSSTVGWRLLGAALAVGAILRAAALPLGGTGDVAIWKVWSFGAAHDVTGMYGVGGSPPNQRVVHWNGEAMTVDYPPVALYELGLAGRAYQRWDPLYRDSSALNVFVKLPGVLFEIALVTLVLTLGRRWYGDATAHWAAVALWLNPALVMNGAVLGYLDPLMYVPLAAAVVAACIGSPWVAGACGAIAVLTKAQAIFAVPVIVTVVVVRGERRLRDLAAFACAAGASAAIALIPFVVRGAWPNLVQSLGRLLAHDMISAQSANVWWIVTWLIRVADSVHDWGWYRALTQEVRILKISTAIDVGYPDFRMIGIVLLAAAVALAMWWASRARSLACTAAIAGWLLYAYTMLGAQVHENHLAAAVPILAVAGALDERLRKAFWLVSAIAALNLYFFYGIVPGRPPLITRASTIVDATVLLSVFNVVVFVWFTRLLQRRSAAAAAVR